MTSRTSRRRALFCASLLLVAASAWAPVRADSATTTMPDATQFQVDSAHSGYQSGPFGTKLRHLWRVSLDRRTVMNVGYALIAQGRVFFTYGGDDAHVTAVSATSGHTIWGPIGMGMSNTNGQASAYIAYDNGSLFVLASDGLLEAIEPSSGQIIWQVTLPNNGDNYAYANPPVAVDGIVYASASDQSLYARRETDGSALWQGAGSAWNASPAVASSQVVMERPCLSSAPWTYSATTGTPGWGIACSSGAITQTATIAGGDVLATGFSNPASGDQPNQGVFSLATGQKLRPLVTDDQMVASDGKTIITITAVKASSIHCGTYRYLVSAQQLQSGSTRWIFHTCQSLALTPPLIVGSRVLVRSTTGYDGTVFELDLTTGQLLWQGVVPVLASCCRDAARWQTMNAGDGLLLVPSYDAVDAFASG